MKIEQDTGAMLGLCAFILACMLLQGCLAPVTVNVFSSRMVTAYGTNTTTQAIEGGAAVTPAIGVGDQAISNLATTAKDAFEVSSGAKAAGAIAPAAIGVLGAKL